MKDRFTAAALRLEGQPMFRLLEQVKQMERDGRNIIHFEIGDPDFDTPQTVVDSCIDSLKRGETHYASSYGVQELREAVCDFTMRDLGFRPDLDQVLISPGANALIYFVIQCLVKPDEEVIVPDPAFSTYYSVLQFLNLKAVRVPLKEDHDFRLDPEDVRRHITAKTKLIIINSPHNPTGSVMRPDEVDAIVRIAQEHDLFILSDEIYRRMTYGPKPASPSYHDQCRTRTILMTGFSKSYAMTGWRLGYMVAPPPLVEKAALLLQTIVSCVPTFIQKAGVKVLNQEFDETRRMLSELEARKNRIVQGLNALPGVHCVNPDGAFYVFPNVTKTGMSGECFADLMLQEAGVALLPGHNFGQSCEGNVRLCYANSIDNINEGLSRMKKVLEARLGKTVPLEN